MASGASLIEPVERGQRNGPRQPSETVYNNVNPHGNGDGGVNPSDDAIGGRVKSRTNEREARFRLLAPPLPARADQSAYPRESDRGGGNVATSGCNVPPAGPRGRWR